MRFIKVGHMELKINDVLWREEDGAYRIWVRRQLKKEKLMVFSSIAQVRVEWQRTATAGNEESWTYRKVGPWMLVKPFGLNIFLVTDLMGKLADVPPDSDHKEVRIRIQKLIFEYGLDGMRKSVTIRGKHLQRRNLHYDRMPLPKSEYNDKAVPGIWELHDGTRVNLGDLSDRHLRNIVDYSARVIANRYRQAMGRLDDPDPPAVQEAQRRGFGIDFRAKVQKVLDGA